MLKDSVLMHYSLSTILKALSATDGDPPTPLKRGLRSISVRFPLFLGVAFPKGRGLGGSHSNSWEHLPDGELG